MKFLLVLSFLLGATTDAFTAVHSSRVLSSRIALGATAADAVATLEASQAESVNAIAAAIPDLAAKPDQSWAAGASIAGSPTTLDARDAPGPANVAWVSSLCVSNKLSALTIFNGPLTDVPHLLSRCAVLDDNTMSLCIDFLPRAYGAYETKRDDGTYPGPEELGRQAFEYSGARREFETKFGTEEVASYLSSLAFEGATPAPAASEFEVETSGPLRLAVTMPLTDANVAAAVAARSQVAAYWLGWATDGSHAHRPGAPVNTQYVYDSKFRQNCYSAVLPIYSNLFGAADGATLAAADSGPLDEGYVGGGS